MTKARSVQERAFILSDKHLPLPLGEVAERSEVGEGLPIFTENREKSKYLRCKYSINPLSHACA